MSSPRSRRRWKALRRARSTIELSLHSLRFLYLSPTPVAPGAECCVALPKGRPQIGGDLAKVAAPAQRREEPNGRLFRRYSGEKSQLLPVDARNGCRSGGQAAPPCPHRQGSVGHPILQSQCLSPSARRRPAPQRRSALRNALLEPCTGSRNRRRRRSSLRCRRRGG